MAQNPSASSRALDPKITPDPAEQVKQTAQEAASGAKRQAEGLIDEQKQEVASTLGSVADALHAAGDRLEKDEHSAFAEYAHGAAEQVERFTSSIRSRSVGEILDEAERFAYREPGLFIGGAFLLGIVGARFFKASSPRSGVGDRYRSPSPRSYRPYGGGRPSDYGRSSGYGRPSGYGRSTPDYGGSVTEHGRPLVTNTPGARMPETGTRPSGTSGTSAGASAGTPKGSPAGTSAGSSAETSTGASGRGSDSPRRNP